MTTPNETNILSMIPGQYVAASSKTLPHAATAAEEFQEATIEVPHRGNVRITFRRFNHKHGKSYHSFWTAIRAVSV